MLPLRKSKHLVAQRMRSLSEALEPTSGAYESPAVARTTSDSSVPFHHETPPNEDFAVLAARKVVSLKIEASVNGKNHTLWFVVPDTSQLAVFQLENSLRDHLRYESLKET